MSLRKSIRQKTITGALGGLSEYWQIDYTWLRLIFVLLTVLTRGYLVIVYMLLVLLMPRSRYSTRDSGRKRIIAQTYFFINLFFKDLVRIVVFSRYRKLFGLVFLVLGLLWLSNPLTIMPALLMLIGVLLSFNPFGLNNYTGIFWQYQYGSTPNISSTNLLKRVHERGDLPRA